MRGIVPWGERKAEGHQGAAYQFPIVEVCQMILKQTFAAVSHAADVDPERAARARSLARLLFHAMLDAEDLDCDAAAEKMRDGIELIKKKFALNEDALLPPFDRATESRAPQSAAR